MIRHLTAAHRSLAGITLTRISNENPYEMLSRSWLCKIGLQKRCAIYMNYYQPILSNKPDRKFTCSVLDIGQKFQDCSDSSLIPFKLAWNVSGEPPVIFTNLNEVTRGVVLGPERSSVGIEWKPSLTYWQKSMRSPELQLPRSMDTFMLLARAAFIAAIKEQMEGR